MDPLVPPKPTLRVAQSQDKPTRAVLAQLDHLLVVLPASLRPTRWPSLPGGQQLARLAARTKAADIPRAHTRLSSARATGVSVVCFDPTKPPFEQLTRARKAIAAVLADHPASVGVYAAGFTGSQWQQLVQACVVAASAAVYQPPSFKTSTSRQRRLRQLRLLGVKEKLDLRLVLTAQAHNDLARWLTALPPNLLTAAGYRTIVKDLAAQRGFGYEFFNEKRLEKLGAGAFLAVSQGNRTRDAGIMRLRYRPRRGRQAEPPLALVGKGILFDTGGTNLKPFKSMLEMHTDMGGSAVALGVFLTLVQLGVPYPVDTWLAVTENRMSATAYKSQDVITAANGKTIQVIHTDAEGRMVLADTLALAAREQPAVILDYATLTGSCVAALTERYCGVFSNRPSGYDYLVRAGVISGERVWPFPMDEDYDQALASEVADIKQCAAAGSGDHILAARFLSQFVPAATPWVHMDLSAAEHKGGLGPIPTNITGFGIHYSAQLLRQAGSPAALAARLSGSG